MYSFVWEISKTKMKILQNDPSQNLGPDGYIVIWCSYSPEMKLQYIENTLHGAHVHINIVFRTRNMFEEVRTIKSLGDLGTEFTYAPVWQRAVNRQPGSRANNS